jgi:ParB-like chromosome segregation protein Spo0J
MMTQPEASTVVVVKVPLTEIGESLAAFRLVRPALEERMRRSLEVHGQLMPATAWVKNGRHELVDGFKRLRAARRIPRLTELTVQLVTEDVVAAKRAILTLNQEGAGVSALEEAWVIQSLMREDQLSQARVATLLGRGQSWVSRRLSLAERLIEAAREDVRLGLLSPTAARSLAVMPRGIQERVLLIIRNGLLTSRQVATLVGLVATATPAMAEEILAWPQEALSGSETTTEPRRDQRLGTVAAELDRQAHLVRAVAARLEAALERMDFLALKKTEQTLLVQSLRILWRQMVQLQRAMRSKLCPTSPSPEPTAGSSVPRSSPAEPISRTSSSSSIV